MPIVWIHRVNSADIFVPVFDIKEAIAFASLMLFHNIQSYTMYDVNYDEFYSTHCTELGSTSNLQLYVISDSYEPKEGWEFWNASGYIKATTDEALELGASLDPEGFIPGESSKPWVKETRTHADLDYELDVYMGRKNTTVVDSSFLKRFYSMFSLVS